MPGTYQAVYNASKSFVQSFAAGAAQRAQGHRRHGHLADARADRHRVLRARRHGWTPRSAPSEKDDPADVAREGFEALMAGKERVVSARLRPRPRAAADAVLPDALKAEMHRKMAEPGSAEK